MADYDCDDEKLVETTEWSNERIVHFINLYRTKEMLWDTTHNYYKLKHKKHEAWMEIANEMEMEVYELKRKMNALMATYRKLRRNVILSNQCEPTAESEAESYIPWFAYEHFAFLRHTYKPQNIPDNQYEKRSTPQRKKLRKDEAVNVTEAECHSVLIKEVGIKTNDNDKDEFDAYAEFIAKKLRSMDKRTVAYVQKAFGNVLFDAEMGMYSEPEPQSHGTISPTISMKWEIGSDSNID